MGYGKKVHKRLYVCFQSATCNVHMRYVTGNYIASLKLLGDVKKAYAVGRDQYTRCLRMSVSDNLYLFDTTVY